MELRAGVATFAIVFYLAIFVSPTTAACTNVDYSTDRCRGVNSIWLAYPVKRAIERGAGRIQINLRRHYSHFTWYCGPHKERFNAGSFLSIAVNRLDVSFENDGAIRWWAYICERCFLLETTYDRCGNENFIKVLGHTLHRSPYRNGCTKKVIRLPGDQSQVYWYCGPNNYERTAWDKLANQLTINYCNNGRIKWEIKKCD